MTADQQRDLAECKEPRCQDIHAEPWISNELGDLIRQALSDTPPPAMPDDGYGGTLARKCAEQMERERKTEP